MNQLYPKVSHLVSRRLLGKDQRLKKQLIIIIQILNEKKTKIAWFGHNNDLNIEHGLTIFLL